jgi:hypothetical protein
MHIKSLFCNKVGVKLVKNCNKEGVNISKFCNKKGVIFAKSCNKSGADANVRMRKCGNVEI